MTKRTAEFEGNSSLLINILKGISPENPYIDIFKEIKPCIDVISAVFQDGKIMNEMTYREKLRNIMIKDPHFMRLILFLQNPNDLNNEETYLIIDELLELYADIHDEYIKIIKPSLDTYEFYIELFLTHPIGTSVNRVEKSMDTIGLSLYTEPEAQKRLNNGKGNSEDVLFETISQKLIVYFDNISAEELLKRPELFLLMVRIAGYFESQNFTQNDILKKFALNIFEYLVFANNTLLFDFLSTYLIKYERFHSLWELFFKKHKNLLKDESSVLHHLVFKQIWEGQDIPSNCLRILEGEELVKDAENSTKTAVRKNLKKKKFDIIEITELLGIKAEQLEDLETVKEQYQKFFKDTDFLKQISDYNQVIKNRLKQISSMIYKDSQGNLIGETQNYYCLTHIEIEIYDLFFSDEGISHLQQLNAITLYLTKTEKRKKEVTLWMDFSIHLQYQLIPILRNSTEEKSKKILSSLFLHHPGLIFGNGMMHGNAYGYSSSNTGYFYKELPEKQQQYIQQEILQCIKNKNYNSVQQIHWLNFIALSIEDGTSKFYKIYESGKLDSFIAEAVSIILLPPSSTALTDLEIPLMSKFWEKWIKYHSVELANKDSQLWIFLKDVFGGRSFQDMPLLLRSKRNSVEKLHQKKIKPKQRREKYQKAKTKKFVPKPKNGTVVQHPKEIRSEEEPPEKILKMKSEALDLDADELEINFLDEVFEFSIPKTSEGFDVYVRISTTQNGIDKVREGFNWKKYNAGEVCNLSKIFGKNITLKIIASDQKPTGDLSKSEDDNLIYVSYKNEQKREIKFDASDIKQASPKAKPTKSLEPISKPIENKESNEEEEEFYLYLSNNDTEHNCEKQEDGSILISFPNGEFNNVRFYLNEKKEIILYNFQGKESHEVLDFDLKSELIKIVKGIEKQEERTIERKEHENELLEIHKYFLDSWKIFSHCSFSDFKNKNNTGCWQGIGSSRRLEFREKISQELQKLGKGYYFELIEEKKGKISYLKILKIGCIDSGHITIKCDESVSNFCEIIENNTNNHLEKQRLEQLGKRLLACFAVETSNNTVLEKKVKRKLTQKDWEIMRGVVELLNNNEAHGFVGQFEKPIKIGWNEIFDIEYAVGRRGHVRVERTDGNITFKELEYDKLEDIFEKHPNFKQYFLRRVINTYQLIKKRKNGNAREPFQLENAQTIIDELFEINFTPEEKEDFLSGKKNSINLLEKKIKEGDTLSDFTMVLLGKWKKAQIGITIVEDLIYDHADLDTLKDKMEAESIKRSTTK